MQLARRLVSGVDIWMNTPTRPLEASGTSGEKALMNGVVNLSVLDGWWLEGYREGAGWALTEKRTYQDQGQQDQLDAATIYSLLEKLQLTTAGSNEIMPLYYARTSEGVTSRRRERSGNNKGISTGWIQVIKNSIAQIAPHYTMKRQLDDYYTKFYNPLAERFGKLSANDNRLAKQIAQWKETVAERWDGINVVSVEKDEDAVAGNLLAGAKYHVKMVVDEQGLDDAIGMELVTVSTDKDGKEHVFSCEALKMTGHEGNLYTFEIDHVINNAGQFRVAYRLFPQNKNLPHRQDFCYVKWYN